MAQQNNSRYQERYGQYAGNRMGNTPDFTKCCAEVPDTKPIYKQCSRSRGHGPDGAYCKQHAKKLEN